MLKVLLTAILLTSLAPLYAKEPTKEAIQREDLRLIGVKEFQKNNVDTFSVFIKGFCWSSWGIGLRRKIKKLDFVDRSRFNEGVSFDAEYAVVHFAATNKN